MNNLVSIFDSMMSDVMPRGYRSPWYWRRHKSRYDSHASGVSLKDNVYTFEISIPGVDKENLHMELNDSVLSISTKYEDTPSKNSTEETCCDSQSQCCTSQNQRKYHDNVQMPEDIDSSQLHASLQNGILTITVPKKEEEKTNSITIPIE